MAKRKSKKKQEKEIKLLVSQLLKLPIALLIILVLQTCLIVGGMYYNVQKVSGNNANVSGPDIILESSNLSVHFLELGNEYAGDCVYIKVGDIDILVDAGSRTSSVPTITNYIDDYCTDMKLEYVIATHADQDHIAGFSGATDKTNILKKFDVDTIITFAQTNKTTATYNNFVSTLNDMKGKGSNVYTAKECMEESNGAKSEFKLDDNTSIKILDNKFYYEKSSDENNHSVCFLLTSGGKNFMFTGDLEEAGEEELVKRNDLPSNVELFKAGHHGSKTSSNECLLSVIKPKICVACCVAGSVEYTQNFDNTFPTQDFINRIHKYTDKVYITSVATVEFSTEKNKYVNTSYTSMNGNVVVSLDDVGLVSVHCSNNDTILKDTEWFQQHRSLSL